MVTVLTETSLIEQGVSKELFTESKLNTDLLMFNSVNPPTKKERAKSSGRMNSDRRRTQPKSEFSSKTQEEMNEMLNFTQKAFSSQLRQKHVKNMRY